MASLGVKVSPSEPTSTCSILVPPTGSPSSRAVLVDALDAFFLYSSRVFPEVGLQIVRI